MASFVVSRRVGRRFAFIAPVMFAAVAARAQDAEIQFKRSSLVIVSSGHDIKFEI
jgi:hypothetical protein